MEHTVSGGEPAQGPRRDEDERLPPPDALGGREDSSRPGRGEAPRRHHRRAQGLLEARERNHAMKAGSGNGSLYQIKNRRGEVLPMWHMKYYVPGRKEPIRESAKTA